MKNNKIACIGDSLTFGYNLETSQKWTSLLATEIHVQVMNFGINGDTTAGMLSRFNEVLHVNNLSHIIILGGTNDLWFGLNDELIISNIFAMCRQAMHHGLVPIVGIPTPCLNLNELNFIDEDYAECLRSFQTRLKDFCELKEIHHINFSANIKQRHFLDDNLHLNASGQQVMMENARDVIMQLHT